MGVGGPPLTFWRCWTLATVSGWKSSLSVRQSFQYRMMTITSTTSTGTTTPTMTQRLLLWASGDGLFTLSTAAHEKARSPSESSALLYWAVNAPSTSRNPPTSFQLKTTGEGWWPPEDKKRDAVNNPGCSSYNTARTTVTYVTRLKENSTAKWGWFQVSWYPVYSPDVQLILPGPSLNSHCRKISNPHQKSEIPGRGLWALSSSGSLSKPLK